MRRQVRKLSSEEDRQAVWLPSPLASGTRGASSVPDGMSDRRPKKTEAEKRRAKLERLVWSTKHRDFKGKREDGTKCVLKFVTGAGTCSVPISSLTDAECLDMIPKKVREAEGLGDA